MIYLEKNKNNSRKKILIIVGVLIAVFISIQTFASSLLPSIFTSIAKPFWRAEFSVGSGSLQSKEDLQRENEILKRKIIEYEVKIATTDHIFNENAELRSFLNSTTTKNLTLAPILKRPPFSFYDEFIIDIGKKDGLSTTSVVYADGTVPIGFVKENLGRTSKVILFSSPGQKHEVLIGPKNIPALAKGIGGGQYMIELPQGVEVKEGDFVISSSLDAVIGKVVYVDRDMTKLFQKVLFSSLVNIYGLRWVLVE
jgi:rod shape-determining protein MreC